MSRTPPPPAIAAAAERDLDAMRDCVDLLVYTVRRRLADGLTPTGASVDVYLTLRYGDRSMAAAVAASAVLRIATEGEPGPGHRPERP